MQALDLDFVVPLYGLFVTGRDFWPGLMRSSCGVVSYAHGRNCAIGNRCLCRRKGLTILRLRFDVGISNGDCPLVRMRVNANDVPCMQESGQTTKKTKEQIEERFWRAKTALDPYYMSDGHTDRSAYLAREGRRAPAGRGRYRQNASLCQRGLLSFLVL